MFEEITVKILSVVEAYGAWGVFAVSFIREIIVPIPSALTFAVAGFFLLPGGASFFEILAPIFIRVMIPAASGLTLGSIFIYYIAYLGGKPAITKWGNRFGLSWSSIEGMNEKFRKRYSDEFAIFFLRSFPFFPNFAVSAFCGVVHYSIWSYIIVTFLGTLVRAFLMGVVGWFLGEAYAVFAVKISAISNYLFFAILLGLIIFLLHRKKTF